MTAFFIRLAFWNLFRHGKRTLLSLLAIVVGLTSLGLLFGYIKWVDLFLSSNSIYLNRNGHITVLAKDWENSFYKMSRKSRIKKEHLDLIKNQFSSHKHVEQISEELKALGFLNHAQKSFGVMIRGFDTSMNNYIKTHPEVKKWHSDSLKNYFQSEILPGGTEQVPMCLTQALYKKFQTRSTSDFQLLSLDEDRSLVVADAHFQGFCSTGLLFDEEFSLTTNKVDLSNLLHTEAASSVHFYLKDSSSTEDVLTEILITIQKLKLPLEAYSYRNDKISYYYAGSARFLNFLGGFFSIIISSILVVIITSLIYFSVLERSQEMGTLLSVGYLPHQLQKLFLIESLFILMAGWLLSLVSTGFLIFIVNHLTNIPFRPPGVIGQIKFTLVFDFKMAFLSLISLMILLILSLNWLLKKQLNQPPTLLLGESA